MQVLFYLFERIFHFFLEVMHFLSGMGWSLSGMCGFIKLPLCVGEEGPATIPWFPGAPSLLSHGETCWAWSLSPVLTSERHGQEEIPEQVWSPVCVCRAWHRQNPQDIPNLGSSRGRVVPQSPHSSVSERIIFLSEDFLLCSREQAEPTISTIAQTKAP